MVLPAFWLPFTLVNGDIHSSTGIASASVGIGVVKLGSEVIGQVPLSVRNVSTVRGPVRDIVLGAAGHMQADQQEHVGTLLRCPSLPAPQTGSHMPVEVRRQVYKGYPQV